LESEVAQQNGRADSPVHEVAEAEKAADKSDHGFTCPSAVIIPAASLCGAESVRRRLRWALVFAFLAMVVIW